MGKISVMVGSRAEEIARELDTSAKLQNGKLDRVGVGTQKTKTFLPRFARKPLFPHPKLNPSVLCVLLRETVDCKASKADTT